MTDTDLITAPAEQESAGSAGPESGQTATKTRSRARTGLSGMVLSELRTVAGELGIKGTSGMRKGDLIAAIKERQAAGGAGAKADAKSESAEAKAESRGQGAEAASADDSQPTAAETSEAGRGSRRRGGAAKNEADEAKGGADKNEADNAKTDKGEATGDKTPEGKGAEDKAAGDKGAEDKGEAKGDADNGEQRNRRNRNQNRDNQNRDGGQNRDNREGGQNRDNRDDDGEGGNGRRRGRRFRERRRGRDRDSQNEPQVSEDDVLQPVAGILDVLDNYAFVRTSGYLAGPNDVYVSMNMVRKYGLRRGDAITGAVKVPREGEQQNQRQKFNPLVRIDTVNGGDVEAAKRRPEFNKLTPLYPNERLRLETTPERLSTRVIDLIMPIGKGQRALIVSPPKAGKTTILQDIANAIAVNNPECHLMVVLVDERPEEVTDMQRSVKGEVIASTFDRPPSDHTSVAELAIERAKRLVESGKDVVVLLDSITRLGRAYNNASPASGRILSGGVDSTALYPPKRFLGAARNIENGGSLTIIATAMVETGSTGDTVIFEEFKGTGNAELKLDRKIAERRVFPAVDVNPSGTRKDELLLSPDEFAIVHKLRRLLSGLDSQQAIDLLISQLKKTKTNVEFLMSVQKTAPGAGGDD
ncbi:transcription termination factor Rho [Gordonia paraffinivorans]|uniref:transcription termination factor Rho n=1 Tax=Gordonia paraffinivorans TaxID=175628 RepID=UPI000D61F254|nr:transcription termination factor Rho [Gordonia paraffinivorans]PWD42653.1 transcription termination factor Rho [Gordonia paraffinivorans]